MAINKKRIEAILKAARELPTPEREIEIVRRIEQLLANPKGKGGIERAYLTASADEMIAHHRPKLTAGERAEHIAKVAGVETGLHKGTDAESLARMVRRSKAIVKAGQK